MGGEGLNVEWACTDGWTDRQIGWLTDLFTLTKRESCFSSFPDRSLGILLSMNDKIALPHTLPSLHSLPLVQLFRLMLCNNGTERMCDFSAVSKWDTENLFIFLSTVKAQSSASRRDV